MAHTYITFADWVELWQSIPSYHNIEFNSIKISKTWTDKNTLEYFNTENISDTMYTYTDMNETGDGPMWLKYFYKK